jgi:hypothetical protein
LIDVAAAVPPDDAGALAVFEDAPQADSASKPAIVTAASAVPRMRCKVFSLPADPADDFGKRIRLPAGFDWRTVPVGPEIVIGKARYVT